MTPFFGSRVLKSRDNYNDRMWLDIKLLYSDKNMFHERAAVKAL
jgi:hypothetical protein